MTGPARELPLRTAALLAPFAVYLAGVALLGDWIIDDAGISFAYARNVAAGYGLVAQPGAVPVEGFSNFLWVVLLAPLFLARVFDPIVAPKILGAALVLGAFALLQRMLARRTGSLLPGLIATLLLAASPPLVIWSASGLENGLGFFLLTALVTQAVLRPPRWQLRSGALAALLAMAHPDGLLYAAAGVLVALCDLAEARRPTSDDPKHSPSDDPKLPLHRATKKPLSDGSKQPLHSTPKQPLSDGSKQPLFDAARLPSSAKDALLQAAGFAAFFGPFLAFRLATFGLPLPHPYYAKRIHATPWDRLAEMARHPGDVVTKTADLLRGALGPPGPLLAALTLALAAALLARRRLPREAAVPLALAALAIGGYVFMDDDWMGEYRFGTGAISLAILALVTTAHAAARELAPRLASRAPAALKLAALAVLVIASHSLSLARIVRFAENPTTPFRDIERSFARKADAYADRLGIARASVLLADVGAPLYFSRLTVLDAAGLCEPEVVRTLKNGTPFWLAEHPAFHDWVFERARPTFISTHHFWTFVTDLDADPRFARDYVAIDAYEDAYVKRVYGRSMRSGDFVRRDALADFGRVDALRATYSPPPRLDPLVVRLEEALFGAPPERGDDASIESLRHEAERALDRNDPQRAATLLARLLARRPADLEAAELRATALDAAMRPEEARAEWQRVLDLAPSPASPRAAAARARLLGRLPRDP